MAGRRGGRTLSLARVPRAVRIRAQQRVERVTAARSVRESLLSLAALIGAPVANQAGQQIGTVVDLVARWDGQAAYPPVTGLVVEVGRRRTWVAIEKVEEVQARSVRLATAKLDLREFAEREGEVSLAADVLDHQLVDIEGVRVVRPSDLYLAMTAGGLALVGMDTGFTSLLRRLGPSRWRGRVTAEQVIDWADVQAFGTAAGRGGVRLATPRNELRRLHPAELADLLEDLGRTERNELLTLVEPEQAADALEEMRADQLEELLSEADPAQASGLLAKMEPDEAAEALRDLDLSRRASLLARMPDHSREQVAVLLEQDEDQAGGVMTTRVICVTADQTVNEVRDVLAEEKVHIADVDSVVVVDEHGRLLDDVTLGELLLADPATRMQDLVGPPWPVTVTPDTDAGEIARRFVESRRLSLVVVDEEERPIGRILGDDIVDMLLAGRGRYHFPRILS